MPKCTFKMQFQDTFAWMICLNSLFFLRERQPTVMKFVWEKILMFPLFLLDFVAKTTIFEVTDLRGFFCTGRELRKPKIDPFHLFLFYS